MSLCWFNRALGYKACMGRLDPAHMIPRRRLKNAGCPEEALWDERIIRPICRSHHHSWDRKFIRLDSEDYPDSVHDYASEFGWEWDSFKREWIATAATPSLYAEHRKYEATSLLEES